MTPVYPTANLMVFVYFAPPMLVATGVRSRTFDAITDVHYSHQALPTVLCVAHWVTCHLDFHDNRIGCPVTEMSKLTHPCIGPLSQRVYNLLIHWNKVAIVCREPRAAHCLPSLRRIEEIDLDAIFRDVETSGFGRWLPYNFENGEVEHLGALIFILLNSSVYPAVEREFRRAGPFVAWKHDVTRATFESCQAEIAAYLLLRSLVRDIFRMQLLRLRYLRPSWVVFAKRVVWFFVELLNLPLRVRRSSRIRLVCKTIEIDLVKNMSAIVVNLIRLWQIMRLSKLKFAN